MARRASQIGRQRWKSAIGADRRRHAHRVLHRALERGVENETLARNVASIISPPKVEKEEIDILDDEEVAAALSKLQGHELYSIASTALATGMRRGELLAVRWSDCDLDGASIALSEASRRRRLVSGSSRRSPSAVSAHDLVASQCRRRAARAPAQASRI